jgi:hypothetical protein
MVNETVTGVERRAPRGHHHDPVSARPQRGTPQRYDPAAMARLQCDPLDATPLARQDRGCRNPRLAARSMADVAAGPLVAVGRTDGVGARRRSQIGAESLLGADGRADESGPVVATPPAGAVSTARATWPGPREVSAGSGV